VHGVARQTAAENNQADSGRLVVKSTHISNFSTNLVQPMCGQKPIGRITSIVRIRSSIDGSPG
jgi:hypothetical protein